MSIISAIKAAITEYRRHRALEGFTDIGGVYKWPVLVSYPELWKLSGELGLQVRLPSSVLRFTAGQRADMIESMWSVTLDYSVEQHDIAGVTKLVERRTYLAGVATCVSSDKMREVIVLEKSADETTLSGVYPRERQAGIQ